MHKLLENGYKSKVKLWQTLKKPYFQIDFGAKMQYAFLTSFITVTHPDHCILWNVSVI